MKAARVDLTSATLAGQMAPGLLRGGRIAEDGMQRVRMLGYAAVALALAGCQSTGTGSVGDAVSAYAAPTALTALAGGLVGNQIGRDLNAKDRRAALEAEYRALEYGRTGQPVVWRGRSGRGEVVAGPPYQVNDYDCRDYTHTITTKGQSETARGTACRRPNGTWKPVA